MQPEPGPEPESEPRRHLTGTPERAPDARRPESPRTPAERRLTGVVTSVLRVPSPESLAAAPARQYVSAVPKPTTTGEEPS